MTRTRKDIDVSKDTLHLITKPLEPWELLALDTECEGVCPVECVVAVPLEALFAGIEATNDFVSEAITGTVCLQDISYAPVGGDPKEGVYLNVGGYILAEDVPKDGEPNDASKAPKSLTKRNTTLSHLIDIESIADSMLVDSGTEIIALSTEFECEDDEVHYVKVAIETAGEVDVTYQGKRYTEPSEFPHSLKRLIRATRGVCLAYDSDDGIKCDANNWFERVVYIDDEMFGDPEVVETDFTIICPEEVADELAECADRAMSRWLTAKTS